MEADKSVRRIKPSLAGLVVSKPEIDQAIVSVEAFSGENRHVYTTYLDCADWLVSHLRSYGFTKVSKLYFGGITNSEDSKN